jgi:hypothetical protein
MGKTKVLFSTLQPLGSFSHMVACKSSSKNTREMNLIPVLNKTSPQAHIELELDVLGVPGKLVKYVIHSLKKKIEKKKKIFTKKKLKKIYFSSHKLPKQQSTSFWSQGILGVKWIRI